MLFQNFLCVLKQIIKCSNIVRTATSQPVTKSYQLHNLSEGPKTSVTVTSEEALKYYKEMVEIRHMEQSCANLYTQKAIRGFCHLYIGQEATCIGIFNSMKPDDTLITSYRCHPYCYLMGASMLSVVSELTGRKSGNAQGKGGSMHMYAKNFYGGNGIVGAQVPLGTGIAFRHKYLNKPNVSYTLYGDGAANQGQVFEAFNIAKLFNLPVFYICENNVYALGTKDDRHAANTKFYTRCEYIPGVQVDGMDILAVVEAAKFCREYIASGKGPIIMESKCYRYLGHSMSDPGIAYRTREEVAEMRKARDPINNFKKFILEEKLVPEEELAKIDQMGKDIQGKLEKEALAEAPPPMSDLSLDVIATCDGCICRNVSYFKPLKHGLSRKPLNLQ